MVAEAESNMEETQKEEKEKEKEKETEGGKAKDKVKDKAKEVTGGKKKKAKGGNNHTTWCTYCFHTVKPRSTEIFFMLHFLHWFIMWSFCLCAC